MSDEVPLEAYLFHDDKSMGSGSAKVLFEQYKLFVQTSETLVSRRQNANTFFLSVNTVLLTAAGLIIQAGFDETLGGVAAIGLSLAAIMLCEAWRRLVESHRQLNRGKFRVIDLLESRLPASLYAAERKALGEGKDRQLYRPTTQTEEVVPRIFQGLYLIAALLGSLKLVGAL